MMLMLKTVATAATLLFSAPGQAQSANGQSAPSRFTATAGPDHSVLINWQYQDMPADATVTLERSDDGLNFSPVCMRSLSKAKSNRFMYVDEIEGDDSAKYTYRLTVTSNGQRTVQIKSVLMQPVNDASSSASSKQ